MMMKSTASLALALCVVAGSTRAQVGIRLDRRALASLWADTRPLTRSRSLARSLIRQADACDLPEETIAAIDFAKVAASCEYIGGGC